MASDGAQAFEALHSWNGNARPEPETPAFQEGKARSLHRILPLTALHSVEAACVVLQADGSEWDFQTGTQREVRIAVPQATRTFAALLHSPSPRGGVHCYCAP